MYVANQLLQRFKAGDEEVHERKTMIHAFLASNYINFRLKSF